MDQSLADFIKDIMKPEERIELDNKVVKLMVVQMREMLKEGNIRCLSTS